MSKKIIGFLHFIWHKSRGITADVTPEESIPTDHFKENFNDVKKLPSQLGTLTSNVPKHIVKWDSIPTTTGVHASSLKTLEIIMCIKLIARRNSSTLLHVADKGILKITRMDDRKTIGDAEHLENRSSISLDRGQVCSLSKPRGDLWLS